jgi:uncharacterized protein
MLKLSARRTLFWIASTCLFSLRAMEPEAKEAQALFFDAVRKRDREGVIRALEAGADINALNGERHPLIQAMVYYYNRDVALELIKRGADVNAATQGGIQSALDFAAQRRDLEIMKELITRGAYVNAAAGGGATPLYEVARLSYYEGVRELLIYGARAIFHHEPVLAIIRRLLPDLERIIVFGTLSELKELIERRREVFNYNYPGRKELEAALALAVGQGRADIVEFLLDNHDLSLSRALQVMRVIRQRFGYVRDALAQRNVRIIKLLAHQQRSFEEWRHEGDRWEIRSYWTRFDRLPVDAQAQRVLEGLEHDWEHYKAVYDVLLEHIKQLCHYVRQTRLSMGSALTEDGTLLYHSRCEPITYLGFLPSELAALLRAFLMS